ncbi:diguanylate cyclase/phosphodiesterase with PAS/PAC sensor(s) [Desulfofarcimen acetoxidans DSM 771]|uniref:Diguanylate cyclase/phosphodiesterase with PAS/PAC sensor(S) n=1 Tax=Desulfofarcimen acetoxidans (strain ATCC 49208 / DSM 771 / KCTC 5769 / VKM B-1644 / 5575) TaxID=485916 RepID=C8VVE0_DESAS|nr:diguanylate cyclase/phosphodiesterase with PAS/PAC sensor(s) [Desulfofarcimen acetoxidans DSM 771]
MMILSFKIPFKHIAIFLLFIQGIILIGYLYFNNQQFNIKTAIIFLSVASSWPIIYHYLYEKDYKSYLLSIQNRYLTKYANDIVFLLDSNFNFIEINDKAIKTYGYSHEEFFKMKFYNLCDQEKYSEDDEVYTKIDSHDGYIYETIHKKKDGSTFPVEISSRTIIAGGKKHYHSIIRNITERKKTEAILRRYQLLSENTRDIILFVRSDGQIIDANLAALQAYGYNSEDILTLNIQNIREKATRTLINYQLREAVDKGIVFETIHQRKDGSTFPVEVSSKGALLEGEQIVVSIIRDISERKKFELQIKHLATHDYLTNIPNRYYLEESLKRYVAKAKRGTTSALLLLDLDNFKLVNDTKGHVAGDELLIIFTKILKANLREEDLLTRLGGDEFAVLLEGISINEATEIAEKLRAVIDNQTIALSLINVRFNLTVSIGLSMVDGSMDPIQILSQADRALYIAKESGRNRVITIKGVEDTEEKLTMTNQLISLIKKALRDNLFEIVFQPIVKVAHRDIIHFEALLRLKDDHGHLISPGHFIPVAERFGMMAQIDLWVLQSVIDTLRMHEGISIFINISGTSLSNERLLNQFESIVLNSSVEPSRLGFEITETAAARDMIKAEQWIRKLKRLGCKFAIDDFGIGFSSFSYLRLLPVDYLKIDGSFIYNIDQETTNLALVKAMNTVAHTLDKKTIAEFVENENILQILNELDVDYAQGYFIGIPAQIEQYVMNKNNEKQEHLD